MNQLVFLCYQSCFQQSLLRNQNSGKYLSVYLTSVIEKKQQQGTKINLKTGQIKKIIPPIFYEVCDMQQNIL